MSHRASFLKTTAIVAFLGVVACGCAILVRTLLPNLQLLALPFCIAALIFWLVALGGLTVLYRDRRAQLKQADWFLSANAARSESRLLQGDFDIGLRIRQIVRSACGLRSRVVSDWVQVRSLEEIRATLDANGACEALPFMAEMEKFCGRYAQVFRRVDKIYDYGGAKNLRRLQRTVLLHGLRCDGAAHGGCEADCYVMWKEAWLKPSSKPANWTPPIKAARTGTAAAGQVFTCQFTQLVKTSTLLKEWDYRQDLRPLWAGNVTAAAFAIAMLTRLFNYAQGLRLGATFPAVESTNAVATPNITKNLQAGQRVTVVPFAEIRRTLDKNNRNRGLWFDRDMIKHCEHPYVVDRQIHRIIDDATGLMREMKTACIALEGVNSSGEYLRFCAQEDILFWREAWLAPVTDAAAPK